MKTIECPALRSRETPRQILTEDFKDKEWPISGGWGYTMEDAVVIELDNESNAISLEGMFANARAIEELVVFRPKDDRLTGIKVTKDIQALFEENGHYYDKVEYTVTAFTEADYAMLLKDFRSFFLTEGEELQRRQEAHDRLRAEKMLTYKTACWFDITACMNAKG